MHKTAGYGNKKLILFLLTSILLILTSCRNVFYQAQLDSIDVAEEELQEEKEEKKFYTVTGTVGISLPENNARTAMPAVDLTSSSFSSLSYIVEAENQSDSSKVTGEITISATEVKYKIYLSDGTWKLNIKAYTDAAHTNQVFAGSTVFTIESLTLTSGSTSVNLTGVSSGTGTVTLPVKIAADSGITSGKAVWTVGGVDKEETLTFDIVNSVFEDSFNLDDGSSNAPAGAYTVRFIFYKGPTVAYSFVETINVFNGLETNKWLNSTSAVYLTGNSVLITKALVQSYALKTFYVDPVNGSDSESGDFFFPVSSVQRAVNMIDAVNDGVSEYSIILNGDFTADDSMTFQQGGLNEYNVVCIDPSSDLKLKIKSNKTAQKRKIDAAASASSERRGIYVGAKADVELENLIISNGYVDAKNGGGIFLDGKLTINTCEISHNTVTGGSNYYGGGIYVSTSGTLIADTIDVNNNVSSGGAGIHSEGTTTVSNSFISSNVCNAWGGGLRISSGKTEAFNTEIYDNSAKYGAGIEYVLGEVLLSDCYIHDNTITIADVYAGADILLCDNPESKTFTITKNTIVKGIISTRTKATKNYKKLVVQNLTGSADTQIFKINVQDGAFGDLVVYGMNGYEDRFKVYSDDGLSELDNYTIDSAGKLSKTTMSFGGSLVHALVLNNDITFASSTATVSKATGGAITITSTINSNPVADLLAEYEGFKVEVLSYGVKTPVENDSGLAKVVIPTGWPAGKYELYITGKYQGVEYNASLYFDLTE